MIQWTKNESLSAEVPSKSDAPTASAAPTSSAAPSLTAVSSHTSAMPEYREWSIAAVRLIQGVIYSDDEACWDILLRSRTPLESYMARIGLILVVDEPEGLAYLRQMNDDESIPGYSKIPKLFRKSRLGYETTLLCILLRDALRRFEEEDLDNQRCVIQLSSLFDTWKSFFPKDGDEVRLRKGLEKGIRKLEELKFVKRFGDDGESWEVRRILKARLPVEELERLRLQLSAAAGTRSTEEHPSIDERVEE